MAIFMIIRLNDDMMCWNEVGIISFSWIKAKVSLIQLTIKLRICSSWSAYCGNVSKRLACQVWGSCLEVVSICNLVEVELFAMKVSWVLSCLIKAALLTFSKLLILYNKSPSKYCFLLVLFEEFYSCNHNLRSLNDCLEHNLCFACVISRSQYSLNFLNI